eukprot:7086635-Prymnesium_polylepis.1
MRTPEVRCPSPPAPRTAVVGWPAARTVRAPPPCAEYLRRAAAVACAAATAAGAAAARASARLTRTRCISLPAQRST